MILYATLWLLLGIIGVVSFILMSNPIKFTLLDVFTSFLMSFLGPLWFIPVGVFLAEDLINRADRLVIWRKK